MKEAHHQQGCNHSRGTKTNHRLQFVVIYSTDRAEKEPGCKDRLRNKSGGSPPVQSLVDSSKAQKQTHDQECLTEVRDDREFEPSHLHCGHRGNQQGQAEGLDQAGVQRYQVHALPPRKPSLKPVFIIRSSGVGGGKHLPHLWQGPMKTSSRMYMSWGAFVAVSNCWLRRIASSGQTSSHLPQYVHLRQ